MNKKITKSDEETSAVSSREEPEPSKEQLPRRVDKHPTWLVLLHGRSSTFLNQYVKAFYT